MENAVKEIGLKFAQATVDLALTNAKLADLQLKVEQLETKLNEVKNNED